MSRLSTAVRNRREIRRANVEINRAISNAATPAMRDELVMVAQRHNTFGSAVGNLR